MKFYKWLLLLFLVTTTRYSFAQNVSILSDDLKYYGPFYVEPDSGYCPITIVNGESNFIEGKLLFSVYNSINSLVMESDVLNTPSIHIDPFSNACRSENLSNNAFNFYDPTFETEFNNESIKWTDGYSIKAKFFYTVGGGGPTLTTLDYVIPINGYSIDTINVFSPQPIDTLSLMASTINFLWDKVLFQDNHIGEYRFTLCQMNVGQNIDQALNSNTPLIDTVIEENSFEWVRGVTEKEILYDTLGNLVLNYAYKIKSVLSSSEDTVAAWDNTFKSSLSFKEIEFPWNNPAYDSLPAYHTGSRWGFPSEAYGQSNYWRDISKLLDKIFKNLSCPNGGVDDGNFDGWSGGFGTHTANSFNVTDNKIYYDPSDESHSQHFIYHISDGDDPLTGAFPKVPPSGSPYSIRLGDLENGSKGAFLNYDFTVSILNQNFQFLYAVVLEDIGHDPSLQPWFMYQIKDLTTNTVLANLRVVANRNNPYFTYIDDDAVVYKNWTCVPVDLTGLIGHNIRASFWVTDCTLGAHRGYAYIDGLCENNTPTASFTMDSEFCLNDVKLANGSASTNESSHFWSVQESDINWNTYGTEISKWYVGKLAGQIDINEFYTSNGGVWKPDTYYRVKLAVSSLCGEWIETVKLIYIKPAILTNAGQDKDICPGGSGVTIGTSPGLIPMGTSFSWNPTTGLSSPTTATTLANPSSTTVYTLTTTDPDGCTTTDEVKVFVHTGPPDFTLSYNAKDCALELKASVQANNLTATYEWSDPYIGVFATDQNITVYNQQEITYTLKVTNGCGSTTKSITVPPVVFIDTMRLTWPDIFKPTTGLTQVTRVFYIYDWEFGQYLNEYPAYGVNEFRFILWNEWGTLIKHWPVYSKTGFANGAINWDGYFNGKLCQEDYYNWYILYKNCKYNDWVRYKEYQTQPHANVWGKTKMISKTYDTWRVILAD